MKKFLLSLATVLCMGSFASANEVTDVLNNSNLVDGDTKTNYAEHTYTAESGAEYYAQCAGDGGTIQLRSNNNNSGVVVTKSVGTVKSITVKFNSKTAAARVLNVYGSNVPYTSAAALYQGTPVTTFKYADTEQTYTFETPYAYVGVRSSSGALYLDEVEIVWTTDGEVPVGVDAPSFSVAGGIYDGPQTVELSAAEGCTIYYTTDGQNPTDDVDDGSTFKYTAPITVDKTMTIKALAVDADDNMSEIASETYTIVETIAGGEGDGTEANPYNAIAAYNEAILGSTATVYVKGTVVEITEIETDKYGNANYYISADGTATNQFYIYRGYNLGGEKFTSNDQLKVGDKVVVNGKLSTYNGVPQLASGNKIVSINGEEPEPIVLEGEGTEEKPFTVADVIAINPAKTDANEEYPDKYWINGYIVGYCPSAKFEETVFDANNDSSNTNIILGPTADCTDITLCIPVQLPNNKVREALNLKANPERLHQEVTLYGNIYKYFNVAGVKNVTDYRLASSGVAAVEIDENAPVEYFNLQGVRVDNPANGLYIMRQGDKVVKVIK